ncbi:MAG: glycosyltransferase family 4 protein [bacterium]|nr:glycosyltransferase family 4 protein [bacterium]
MKVLIVVSGNIEEFNMQLHHAFVHEQIASIKENFNLEFDIYQIKGKGITGYLKNLSSLKKHIGSCKPDIVHAHFGLSGLLAVMQRKVPVIITFHGSDINLDSIRPLSVIASKLSKHNIFVSDKILKKVKINGKSSVIPCGIDLDVFYSIDIKKAREKLNMNPDKKYILFSSHFNRVEKNSSLAFDAVNKLKLNCELLELKNRSREEVNLLLNACDLLLLTSFTEGSPQVIKEAMACNCPIVATDVGDIREVVDGTEGCYITSFDSNDVTEKIKLALQFKGRTNGREKIGHFDNKVIATKVYSVYKQIAKE